MTQRLSPTFRTAAIGFLVSCQLPCYATTLLDYSYPGGLPFNDSPGVPVTRASAFTVGLADVAVTSVAFRLDGSLPMSYEFTAYLFSNSGGQPGVVMDSSHRLFAPGELAGSGLAFYDFAFSAPVSLSAGVSYWVGFGTSSAGVPPYIALTRTLQDFTDNGATPSLSFATSGNYPPDQWTVNAPDMSLVYRLEGSAVPEPTSLSLSLLVCGAFWVSSLAKLLAKPCKPMLQNPTVATVMPKSMNSWWNAPEGAFLRLDPSNRSKKPIAVY